MYAESLGQLMRQKEMEGVYHEAILYSQHLIQHEPLQEQSYRELMRLYALSGDLTGIVRTYKTCVTVLQSELGIDPGEETCKTYDSCLKMRSESDTPTQAVSYSNMEYPCLPHQITTFIGRKREIAEVRELVKLHRLVSLVGAGGVGKTRLALAVAEDLLGDFTDGVRYIDLALLSDHTRVIQTMAFLLGIREGEGTSLMSLLTKHLLNKHKLLFLDNCENAIDAVRYLTDTLLRAVPNIWFLITSRIVLNIQGEVIWRVPTLATPGLSKWDADERTQPDNSSDDCQLETLQQFESVQLFTDRAEAVLPTFSISKDNAWYIGRICQQLDGIPLALELAAARVKLFTVQQIADHLGDALYLLTQGDPMALPHHQTMLATLNWSHNRLLNEAQILFRRLSVFVGEATFDSIEAICSGNDIKKDQILDLLSYLVDKSLIEVGSFNKYMRFRLHEITRQYAFVKLKESGEITYLKNRHLEYFCCLTESMEPDLEGGRSTDSSNRQVIETREHGIRNSISHRLYRLLGSTWVDCTGAFMAGKNAGDD
jgi:predicted ATPase